MPTLPPVRLQADLTAVTPDKLHGFFEGWPNPPSPGTLHRLLSASYRISLAVESTSGEVIGFAQAIGDGILSASIPLLEVRPQYRGAGLGTEIMRHLLAQLEHLYAVDLSCDDERSAFYGRLGFRRGTGMSLRRYALQAGEQAG